MNANNLDAELNYLIVHEKDKKIGLTISSVGFQSILPNSQYPLPEVHSVNFSNTEKARVLNVYQFIYITKGSGQLMIESSDEILVSMGQLILVFSHQRHSFKPNKHSGCDKYYIGFEGIIVENLIENSFLSKENQILNVGFNEELVSLFTRAIEIARIDTKATQQHLLGILMHMVGLIICESQYKFITK